MKKIVYSLLATITGLVLLFSYRTSLEAVPPTGALGAGGTGTGTTGSTSGSGTTGSTSGSGTASAPPSSGSTDSGTSSGSGTSSNSGSGTSSNTSGLKNGTFTGQAAGTPYGAVQVQITVSGGRITQVQVPQYPNNSGRDMQINQYALPQLADETVQAQSAQISMISGATFTSEGYLQSLQSAIDQAKN